VLSNALKKLEGKIESLHGLADLEEDNQMKVKNALKCGHSQSTTSHQDHLNLNFLSVIF
jgi:hypothetical protein